MDTAFTRANAKGSHEDAQAEIAKDQICGALPKGFDPAKYSTKPWKISLFVHNGFKVNLGGRTIEIISTPGHTPDAISLIDRANGLLFTGDTFYSGEIWLYRPETDFLSYHNVPVAQPSVLAQLDAAIHAVLDGKVAPKSVTSNQAIYQVGEISFRLRNPLPALNSNPGPN
jgi:glyoxylase-like metal-dependent hydrolase (beta-lactamase superfamily II)